MGKFQNITIVSDMDGTFLADGSKILPENVSAIEYFNKNGGHFTFNTGRGYTTVALRFPEIMHLITAPIGIHNGACIYDTYNNKVLESFFIQNDIAVEISQYLRSFSPEINFTIRTVHEFFALEEQQNGHFQYFADRYPNLSHIISLEDMKKLEVQKIFYKGPQKKIDLLREYVQNTYGEYVQCTTGGEEYIEIDPNYASKARLVNYIKNAFPHTKVFAIGDYENDLKMLRAADVAVCPSNSLDIIKDISDITVCSNNEGALADLIGRL